MDTLQIQDVFEPYYADRDKDRGKRDGGESGIIDSGPAPSLDRKSRLREVNRRFATVRQSIQGRAL